MKKTTSIFILLLILATACSQDKTLAEKFCECFTSQPQLSFNERTENCNPSEKGQNMEMELLLNTIDSCDSYFEEVKNLQLAQIMARAEKELDELTRMDSLTSEEELVLELNKRIKDSDFDSLLAASTRLKSLHPENSDYRFIRAFAFEQLGKFDKALEEYHQLNKLTQSDRYKMSIAIVERRKKK